MIELYLNARHPCKHDDNLIFWKTWPSIGHRTQIILFTRSILIMIKHDKGRKIEGITNLRNERLSLVLVKPTEHFNLNMIILIESSKVKCVFVIFLRKKWQRLSLVMSNLGTYVIIDNKNPSRLLSNSQWEFYRRDSCCVPKGGVILTFRKGNTFFWFKKYPR